VYEFDIPDQGEPYLVMDYLQGESLAEWIANNGPIELTWAISIMCEVCAGLQHAHQAGVLHRDLKPSNIMLVKDENLYKVKLFDFGIAKLLFEDGEQVYALTQTGDFLGSPLYMSPEQCASKSVDARSDVYSLGCVLYEMLTGKPPFQGANLLETLQKQMSSVARPVKEICPDIRNAAKVDSVLLKAMAKQRDERFHSVSEFANAVRGLNDTSKEGIWERAKFQLQLLKTKSKAEKKEHVSKLSLALSSIAALAIVVSILFLNYLRQQQAALTSNARPGTKDARVSSSPEQIQNTDEKPELTWSKLDLQAQQAMDLGKYKDARNNYDKCYKLADQLAARYKLASAEGLSDLNTIMGVDTKKYDQEIDSLTPQVMDSQSLIEALKSVTAKEDASKLITQSTELADHLVFSGRFTQAQQLMRVALAVAKNQFPGDDSINAKCLLSLANSFRISRLDQSTSPELQYRMEAYGLLSKHPEDKLFEACAYSIGRYYNVWDEPDLAKKFLGRALTSAESTFGAYSREAAKCHFQLNVCSCALNDPTLASASAHQALNILQTLKPEEFDADTFHLEASLEEDFKHYVEAAKLFERSLHEYEREQPKNYPRLALCCSSVAVCFAHLPGYQRFEAAALLRRELAILKRIGDLTPGEECTICNSLADLYVLDGNVVHQKEYLQRAVACIQKWPPRSTNRNSQIGCAKKLAELDFKQGDLKEAEKNALLYKSLTAQEYKSYNLDYADADALLGIIYADSHRTSEGRKRLQNALQFYQQFAPVKEQVADYEASMAKVMAKLSELEREQSRQ
jgi:serine/threonine protein kinase